MEEEKGAGRGAYWAMREAVRGRLAPARGTEEEGGGRRKGSEAEDEACLLEGTSSTSRPAIRR